MFGGKNFPAKHVSQTGGYQASTGFKYGPFANFSKKKNTNVLFHYTVVVAI